MLDACELIGERQLKITTSGVQVPHTQLAVRLRSPVLSLTLTARPWHMPEAFLPPANAEAAAEAAQLADLMAPSQTSDLRSFKFKPPVQKIEWRATMPPRAELIKAAGFAEGVLSVTFPSFA